ncbi:MAG TPA: hypothetical protein VEP90_15425 [Methylomirabilota bacterium]|nr:hypothetical protein [Methylomirabilota bacterium]
MYTIKGYKDNLSEENKADILSLFEAVYAEQCEKAEHLLLTILEKLVKRNPEDKPVNQGDFSLIMLFSEAFDDEYTTWRLDKTGNPFQTGMSKSAKTYLLSCCSKKNRMEQLLEEIFHYLERDFYKPREKLLNAIERYKEADSDDEIDKVLSLAPSHSYTK